MKAGFAAALSDQMTVKGWDIARLARELETSYEYARRLTVGKSFPSGFTLKGICKMLDLDQEKMWGLVVSDKITQKYGAVPGKNPRFAELERLLPDLTKEQFQTVLGMVEGMSHRNRMAEPSDVASTRSAASTTRGIYKQAKQFESARPKTARTAERK